LGGETEVFQVLFLKKKKKEKIQKKGKMVTQPQFPGGRPPERKRGGKKGGSPPKRGESWSPVSRWGRTLSVRGRENPLYREKKKKKRGKPTFTPGGDLLREKKNSNDFREKLIDAGVTQKQFPVEEKEKKKGARCFVRKKPQDGVAH